MCYSYEHVLSEHCRHAVVRQVPAHARDVRMLADRNTHAFENLKSKLTIFFWLEELFRWHIENLSSA